MSDTNIISPQDYAEVEKEPTREWLLKRCEWYSQELDKAEAVVRAAENYHGCTKAQPIAAGKCVMCDALAAYRGRA